MSLAAGDGGGPGPSPPSRMIQFPDTVTAAKGGEA